MSGLIPIFMKPDIADPIQFDAVIGTPEAGAVTAEADDEDDANPGVKGIEAGAAADPPDVPATSAGTAASRALMPGTVFSTCAKSSGFINDFAIVKSTPAAPAACSGVEPSSLASPSTNSGLGLGSGGERRRLRLCEELRLRARSRSLRPHDLHVTRDRFDQDVITTADLTG